jgi:hypothetical protein
MEIPANKYNLPELRAELAFRAEQPERSGCFIWLGGIVRTERTKQATMTAAMSTSRLRKKSCFFDA